MIVQASKFDIYLSFTTNAYQADDINWMLTFKGL